MVAKIRLAFLCGGKVGPETANMGQQGLSAVPHRAWARGSTGAQCMLFAFAVADQSRETNSRSAFGSTKPTCTRASAMTPDRWQEVSRLYQSALAQPVGMRAAFLAGACRDDSALRREVESLLAQEQAGVLVDQPVGAAAAAVGLVGRPVWRLAR